MNRSTINREAITRNALVNTSPSEAVYYSMMESPLGDILVAGSTAGICRINFQQGRRPLFPERHWIPGSGPLVEAIRQLREYFSGNLRQFNLPLDAGGTPFQRQVWDALCGIGHGETISYGELAGRIGRPTASRAVGAANGRNPLPIVVPCHRVIGSNGSLTGYAGGVQIKQALLELEGAPAGLRPVQPSLF